MIVAKFGGTSVADAEAIRRLKSIVTGDTEVRVVVVSALAGVTDQLFACGRLADEGRFADAMALVEELRTRHVRLAGELGVLSRAGRAVEGEFGRLEALLGRIAGAPPATPAERDEIAAIGELVSSRFVAATLIGSRAPAEWIDARTVIVTDAEHTRASPLITQTAGRLKELVAPHLAAGRIVVLGGFIGATSDGRTTTLGRGGSDYSASIVGAGLLADRIDIWTDVDGMLTADPRLLPSARLLPRLSFAEASELAYFGAKVLHPSTILPAMARQIPVRIRNSRRPAGSGTLITAAAPPSTLPLRAIACKRDVTVLTITSTRMLMAHGFLNRVFEIFDRHRTVVDVVTTSEVSVSITIDDTRAVDAIVADLSPIAEVQVERGLSLVCAVGERLRTDPGLCARVLHALGGLPLRIVSQAASRQNLTLVVEGGDTVAAIERLHEEFFEAKDEIDAMAPRVAGAGGRA